MNVPLVAVTEPEFRKAEAVRFLLKKPNCVRPKASGASQGYAAAGGAGYNGYWDTAGA